MKIRHLYREFTDHIAYRCATEHVYDPRDLDKDGNPPLHFLRHDTVVKDPEEVEFDHEPTADELRAAFPDFKGSIP